MARLNKRTQPGWYFAGAAALALTVSLLTPTPDLPDYSNLLLVPELAAELDVDLATRIHFAHLGSSLLTTLTGGPVDIVHLEAAGADVAENLNGEQRMNFADRFRAGEIVAVAYTGDFTLNFGWRPVGKQGTDRSLHEVRELLDGAHEWITDEHVALALLAHESDAVNSAAARWLNVNSTEHRGVVSRARNELRHKAALDGLGP